MNESTEMRLFFKYSNIVWLFLTVFSCTTKIEIDSKELTQKLNRVSSWQIGNFEYSDTGSAGYLHDHGIDAWTNGVFYMGLSSWAKTTENKTYIEWLYNIGEKNAWSIPKNFLNYSYGLYHADELCIGQFYLNMFEIYADLKMIASVKERVSRIMNNPPQEGMQATNKQKWTWCDALFMAPPVYARIALLEDNRAYLDFMHKEFMDTYNHLYDKENRLFFRDDSYFTKEEPNGKRIFWGRGNGWVVAGIASILDALPEESEYRPFYEDLFVELIKRLLELVSEDGFWYASLLDPESYPSPETSATALITYAITYGVNNELLDKKTYIPAIEKSWRALISVIDEDGKLGYVQPIGADPRRVTKDMTAVYGVGAFLMAGNEIYRLIENQ